MGFPERLQNVIEEKKISKYKIAKAINISASTISNYIKGKTKPDSTKLTVLCELLGVNKNWLLTGEGVQYLVEEPAAPYNPAPTGMSDKQMVEKLLFLLKQQTESIRERDQQITQLIGKLPYPSQQS